MLCLDAAKTLDGEDCARTHCIVYNVFMFAFSLHNESSEDSE